MSNTVTLINKRKKDHLKIALSEDAQKGSAGFEKYRFVHNALPEINFDQIDTTTSFLGKPVKYPFFISSMTGGVAQGERLNTNLAKAAERYNIPMGVGSQRAAIEHPEIKNLFRVRDVAPHALILANIGLVQLNYGYGLKEFEQAVQMVAADALIVHINPVQEVIQPEGDRNFSHLLSKLEKIIKKLSVPVIAKEVGFGLSYDVMKRLYAVGVTIFDTAGWGGTNWAFVEGKRREGFEDLGELFSDWGIPTTESIKQAVQFKKDSKDSGITILGSGGVRSGIDIAKAIALGSDLVGLAAPFGTAALESEEAVTRLIEKLAYELQVAMFGAGSASISDLSHTSIYSIKTSINS